jgi:hypothetical protein
MITNEQIHDTIDNCPFAHKFYDAVICQLLVEPCVSGVNKGRCPELQKLFSDERKKKATEPFVKLDPETLRDPFGKKEESK